MWRKGRGRGQVNNYQHSESPGNYHDGGNMQNSKFQHQNERHFYSDGNQQNRENQQTGNGYRGNNFQSGNRYHGDDDNLEFGGGRGRGRGRGGRPFRGRGGYGDGQKEMHLELSKPWINSYLKNQIYIKYQLKDASANSKNLSDFEKFQEQRTNVDKLTAMAKEAYFRQHPDEESYWLPILANEFQNVVAHCELCDEDFESEAALHKHESEHQTCGLEGCTFTAHPKQLEDHIFHLHASGLYQRMQTGDTAEEIEKWKADRRKNYPSVDKSVAADEKRKQIRVQKHQNYLVRMENQRKFEEEREEKRKRKLEEDAENKSNKRKRVRKQRNFAKEDAVTSDAQEKITRKRDNSDMNQRKGFVFPEDEECEDRNGDLERFCGTKKYISSLNTKVDSYEKEKEEPLETKDLDISDDDDWANPAKEKTNPVESCSHNNQAVSDPNIQAHSDDDVPMEVPISETKVFQNLQPSTTRAMLQCSDPAAAEEQDEDSDDAPEEVPIVKVDPKATHSDKPNSEQVRDEVSSNIVQKKPEIKPTGRQQQQQKRKADPRPKFKLVHKPRRNPTLLENLLSSEINKERADILQCVRYVCQKNFFGIGQK